MAVIKAVSSKADIITAINYVSEEEKTISKLISGFNCCPETAIDEMQATKELYKKTGGRTYKHFVQSFAAEESITSEQAHDIAKEFVERSPFFEGFEVLIATHEDRKHIHTHFIVNSVSFEDGHKLQQSKSDLQALKDLSDELCEAQGLKITVKGQTFDGEQREDTVAYRKETYRQLIKAEEEKVQSYVQNIALAVMDVREQATSQEEFIRLLKERGIDVDWQDTHKYITFTDLSRKKSGEKKCKVRNNKLEQYYNISFNKEDLLNEFEVNARRTKAEAEARKQFDTDYRRTEQRNSGTERAVANFTTSDRKTETAILIREARAGIDSATIGIDSATAREENSRASRADREAEQQRQAIEESRKNAERERQERERTNQARTNRRRK